MKKEFIVGGMSCSNCSLGIEKYFSSLKGVDSVNVSLMNKTMIIDFDENILSEKDIISSVKKLGYSATLSSNKKADNKGDTYTIKLKKRFVFSLCFLLPLIYLSMGGMLNLPVFKWEVNLVIQAIFALAVMVINSRFFINGTKAVLHGSANMDTLVALGSFSAYVYSLVVLIIGLVNGNNAHAFFEASAMVPTLVTLGKWLEELSKNRTGAEVEKLIKLMPETVVKREKGVDKEINVSELAIGDYVLFRTGDYVCIDGIVMEGVASVDKSAITGESLPEEVKAGNKVVSGSIIRSGYLLIKAEKVGKDTLFSEIIEIVKTAGSSKAPVQKLADKISAYFVPIVTLIAIIDFFVWFLITGDVYKAFNFGISVLVISCPCSLGLATPVAIMVATGKGASCGVLYKNASALQKSSDINLVLLDKTATLTQGKPIVTQFKNLSDKSDDYIFSVVYSLEKLSNHPLANALVEFCDIDKIELKKEVEDFSYQIGEGIKGKIDGKSYFIGSFNDELGEFSQSQTIVALYTSGKTLAIFGISDKIRKESKKIVQYLNQNNIKTVMITGDNQQTAKTVCETVGIEDFVANVLPKDKHLAVLDYKSKGYTVAMVGDGINDSPALKEADVGIAIGSGTDVAIDSADVVLVNGISSLKDVIDLSKRTNIIIKGNLFWALFYNVLSIPIAGGALAFMGVTLTPIIASACMCLSSLFVVTNALRLRKYNNYINKGEKYSMLVKIKGMMCKHCEAKVKETILALAGVEKVEMNLKKGTAKVWGEVSKEIVKNAIENAGYQVIEIKE